MLLKRYITAAITSGFGLSPSQPTTVSAINLPAPDLSKAVAIGIMPAKRKIVTQSIEAYACFSVIHPVKTATSAPITAAVVSETPSCLEKTIVSTTPIKIKSEIICFDLLWLTVDGSTSCSTSTSASSSCEGSKRLPTVSVNAMVASESGIPIQANSKKPNVGKPALANAPVTIIFGGVPTMVSVPPTFAAIAIGIRKREPFNFASAQMPVTTGIKDAAVPVLDNTALMIIVTSITPPIRRVSPVPAMRTTLSPIFCAIPVWNNAAPITNMPANKTTVEFERPEKICFSEITPNKPSAIDPPMEVIASGISSVMNSTATTPRTQRVIIAGLKSIPSSYNNCNI